MGGGYLAEMVAHGASTVHQYQLLSSSGALHSIHTLLR